MDVLKKNGYCSFAYSAWSCFTMEMQGSAFSRSAALRYRLAGDPSSTACFPGASAINVYTDDNEHSRPEQFSACDRIAECLDRHYSGMGKARPCRESNQAAIR